MHFSRHQRDASSCSRLTDSSPRRPFLQANRDFRAVRKHVEHADRVDVDHRQNRCVVFRSALVHETLPFYFERSYDAYRINLSLMYGVSDWRSAYQSKSS